MQTIQANYNGIPNDYLQNVINLQLRKPKNWRWELSTSKSSPHIALPAIRLYNAKGQLLIETRDTASQRKSWHSSESGTTYAENKNTKGCKELVPLHLERCNSDVLQKRPNTKTPSTIDRSTSFNILSSKPREHQRAQKELNKNLNKTLNHLELIADPDDFHKNEISNSNRRNNVISAFADTNKSARDLRKSRSDVLHKRDKAKVANSEPKTFVECFRLNSAKPSRSLGEFERMAQLKTSTDHHRRNRSDDLFKRTMKYNEESVQRAITDGYRRFITTHNDLKRDKNNTNSKHEKEIDINNNENSDSDFVNRYRTRTSSAGTLVILEETFNNALRRRRRKSPNKIKAYSQPEQTNFTDKKQDSSKLLVDKETSSTHARHSSYPTNSQLRKSSSSIFPDRYPSVDSKLIPSKQEKEERKTRGSGLFYSHSDVFPIEELLGDSAEKQFANDSKYTVQEPITSGSDGRNYIINDVVGVGMERKRRRKVRRRNSADSTSSDAAEATIERRKKKGDLLKARVIKDRNKPIDGEDSDLLRLVRQLSTHHVKMGANVSRHSSKGLSGRRSQSSGSICNGKGRHGNSSGETKMCGSLPSYLDDRDTNGCNNNHHDCEKPPLDEVQRIPPLGDGAPLHWKFSDTQTALCDQGYGSERSPEEEYPPPLPEHDNQCHHHLEPHACYPFITPESTFAVTLAKGSRGLGLSVTGGIDSGGSWPGLIRVKRLFPHQPAAACGLLNVGDLLLEANGITLTGLTNYEALEVLRTTPNQVELKVCRPPPDVLSCVSPISEVPPPPPRREPPTNISLSSAIHSTPEDDYYHGDFEVILTKIQGSLGFTLRKEDDSALGHYVRALVREPALNDGRIRAGDRIIAVNDVEISPMSHEQAVQFLRQCGDVVKLRLYRDASQTPVAALSPTETTPRTSFSRKAHLRQEAMDMLNDIAVRKLIPGNQEVYRRSLSPNASPRRLRRQACPSDASHLADPSDKYLITDEQFHEGLLQKCSLPFDDESFNSLFSVDSDECDRPSRPSSLDLYNPNRTPVAARKPKFNFSLAHNAYELNNLDPEVLDAPNLTYNLGNDDGNSTEVECGDSFSQEPASMPHIPSEKPGFSHKNPAYQSAHPQCGAEVSNEKTTADDNNMKKWKGVVFNADEEKPNKKVTIKNDYEILAIELNRGWNSRLGFSLQGAAGVTYVSAVHADSVAARDGRLKPGDRIIKVNDESVENMSTNEIIDLLRIVRGPVCIVVCRTKSKEDCTKSNAAN